jgi:hypothetical protein
MLAISAAAVVALALALPLIPGASLLGFVPLSPEVYTAIIAITALYLLAMEAAKRAFCTRVGGAVALRHTVVSVTRRSDHLLDYSTVELLKIAFACHSRAYM